MILVGYDSLIVTDQSFKLMGIPLRSDRWLSLLGGRGNIGMERTEFPDVQLATAAGAA